MRVVVWLLEPSELSEISANEVKMFPTAVLSHSDGQGYHYVLSCANPQAASLPPHCIGVVMRRKSVSFTTRSLVRENGTYSPLPHCTDPWFLVCANQPVSDR